MSAFTAIPLYVGRQFFFCCQMVGWHGRLLKKYIYLSKLFYVLYYRSRDKTGGHRDWMLFNVKWQTLQLYWKEQSSERCCSYSDEDNNKVSDILVVFCIGLRWTNTTVKEGTKTFFVINYYYNETDILVEQNKPKPSHVHCPGERLATFHNTIMTSIVHITSHSLFYFERVWWVLF